MFSASCYYDKADQVYPVNSCDTVGMTYTTNIKPILDQNCALSGCHDAASASSGYDFSIYDGSTGSNSGALQAAQNGSLLGTVTHASGYSPMPKGSAQLSTCNIDKLTAWVNQGAQQ